MGFTARGPVLSSVEGPFSGSIYSSEPRPSSAKESALFRLSQSSLNHATSRFNTLQVQVDGAVLTFLEGVADKKTLGAMLGGGLVGRLGRIGALALGSRWAQGAALTMLVRGGSSLTGLAAESFTFVGVNRGLNLLEGHPSLQSFSKDWAHTAIALASLKILPALFRDRNPLLQHLLADMGIVGGSHLAHWVHVGEEPEGNLFTQFAIADVMNWQMKGALSLAHGLTPGLSGAEKAMDLTLQGKERGLSSKRERPFSLLSSMAMAGEGRAELPPQGKPSPWTSLTMSGMGEIGGSRRKTQEKNPTSFAQEALEKWRQDPKSPFDYGRFFLEVEAQRPKKPTSEGETKKTFEWWKELLAGYQSKIDASPNYGKNEVEVAIRKVIMNAPLFEKQLSTLSSQFWKVISRHSDEKANMSDFFLCGRGNCSARAKLILSAVLSLEMKLPSHLRWALQIYDNHIETVLYEEKANKIWDLSSGRLREKDKIEASLYDPALFFHAYLAKKGIPTSVTAEDLLIFEVPGELKVALNSISKKWEDPFRFPATPFHFRPGMPPLRLGHLISPLLLLTMGALGFQLFRHRRESSPDMNVPAPAESGQKDQKSEKQVLLWTPDLFRDKEYDVGAMGVMDKFGFTILWDGTAVFKDAEAKKAFEKLSTQEEKYDFLLNLIHRKEETTKFQTSLAFLTAPLETIRETSPQELIKISYFIKESENTHREAFHLLQIRLLGNYLPFREEEIRFMENLKSLSPLRHSFHRNLEIWKAWVHDHPEEFFKLLNDVPLEKKTAVLKLAALADLEKARNLFYDRGLLLSHKKEEESHFDPSSGPQPEKEIEIEIDWATSEFLELSPSPPPPPSASKGPIPEKKEQPTSSVHISPETALVFRFNQSNYMTKNSKTLSFWSWNDSLTQAFRKLNQKGDYDVSFIGTVRQFIWNNGQPIPSHPTFSWIKSQTPPSLWPLLEEIHQRKPAIFIPPQPVPRPVPLPSQTP